MKTNRFNESIRRKLDGLEPTYREADWKRMQQSLHQHGVPSFWPSASQWLLPTVGALTIAGLLITTIWQYRTTQQLRQTVQTLSHTVKDLKENPPVAQTAPPARVDTVYILQNHTAGQGDRYAGRLDGAGSVAGGSGLVPDPQLNERAVATDGPGISEERPSPEATGEQRVAATPGDRSRAEETSASAPSAAGDNRTGSLKTTPSAERTAIQPFSDASANDRRLTSRSATRRSGRTKTGRSGKAFERPGDELSATPVPSVEESGVLRLNVQQLAPVAPSFNTDRFVEGLNRRARRIRSALPLSVGSMASSAAPKAPSIERDEPNVRVRLGLSGALAFKQMAGGVYGEAIVGRHLTVGIGLNRVVESGGKYVTDFQFNQRNHRDFRKEYAHGLDPRFEIFNIARQNYCWKLPVSLGYRMMLGNGLALIPSAGLNINVNTASQEKVEFTEEGPKTVMAGNLMHLQTDYTVDTHGANFPQLGTAMVQLLHPTSAVCGMPREAAQRFILQHEPHERELYSGYLGPVNVDEKGQGPETHLFVNLRCLKLEGQQGTLYAGGGLTRDSVPAKEWRETELKCQTLLSVMR